MITMSSNVVLHFGQPILKMRCYVPCFLSYSSGRYRIAIEAEGTNERTGGARPLRRRQNTKEVRLRLQVQRERVCDFDSGGMMEQESERDSQPGWLFLVGVPKESEW